MKKVCIFHFPEMESFHGYSIQSLDPMSYFPGASSWWKRALLLRQLNRADAIDRMYRERNPSYMRFLRDFIDKFKNADLIVLATYNPIHPEVLHNDLAKPIKVLGFVDDPISTYMSGVPFLWAFDAAFYISPSYNDQILFKDALERWGCLQSYWWPLVGSVTESAGQERFWPLAAPRTEAVRRGDSFFCERDIDLIYVGGAYDDKMDRLIQLKRRFGSRLQVYGRWRLSGYIGATRWLKGKPSLWSRVKAISGQERASLYYRTKIGFNMHRSNRMETGNMRMYEIPAHGMMLLCDKAGLNAHEGIFEPDKEAVFYDSIEDAMEKAEYYLKHDDERERIARAGFARAQRDYDAELNLKNFLDWAVCVEKKSPAHDRSTTKSA